MKKILTVIVLATTITNSYGTQRVNLRAYHDTPEKAFNRGYESGYQKGKKHVYEKMAKNAVYLGSAVIAGIIIYQYGKNSNWTVSENGIGYRF